MNEKTFWDGSVNDSEEIQIRPTPVLNYLCLLNYKLFQTALFVSVIQHIGSCAQKGIKKATIANHEIL